MKVLLINGSPRKNGNTHIALTEVAKTLEANDIQAEIVSIGTKRSGIMPPPPYTVRPPAV